MADKKISDFTSKPTPDGTDLFELETADGNSRKCTGTQLFAALGGGGGGGVPSGTSFPGSPTTDDLYYRTDRRIEYFWDGTRWLSTFEKVLTLPYTGALFSATGTVMRAPNPEFGRDNGIYATRIAYLFRLSGAGTWSLDLYTYTGTSATLLISETYVATTNERFGVAEAVNAVIANTVDSLELDLTEVSGAVDAFGGIALTYRLIG